MFAVIVFGHFDGASRRLVCNNRDDKTDPAAPGEAVVRNLATWRSIWRVAAVGLAVSLSQGAA